MVMKAKSMLSGAIMLSIGGILAKVFSALYRIFLTRILGGQGIGIYQLVFPLYSLCVVLSSAGIPMAISKVIAKNKGNDGGIVKKCLQFSIIISLVLGIIVVLLSKPLASLQGVWGIYVCYLLLAPTIILVSISSVLRGYFQGKQNYTPSALSNILEQATKFTFGISLSLALAKISMMWAIYGAIFAIVLSEVVSLLLLVIYIKKYKLSPAKQKVQIKPILKDILPITATNAIMPIASFVDSLIVVNLLAINFSKSHAIFLYGLSTGAVGSLIGLPTIFSFALASVILPNIVGRTNLNSQFKLNFTLKLVLILTLPCVVLFAVAPKQILSILYGNRIGVEGINISAMLLVISGVGVLFLAVQQLLSTGLQAAERRRVTVKNLLVAVACKFVVEIVLLPIKQINIYALAIGNTVCYFAAMILNYFDILKVYKFNLRGGFMLKLICANFFVMLITIVLFNFGSGLIYNLSVLLLVLVLYLWVLYSSKIFSKKEMAYFKYRV